MIIKNIRQIGDPLLRLKAKKVEKINSKETKRVIKDLTDTLRHADLVGMAAPQIGASVRIFITEIRKTKYRKDVKDLDSLRVFINPEIVEFSKQTVVGYEGCGSVAGGQIFGKVRRSKKVRVRAYNEKGEKFELETGGLLAIVIQHEYDHLNGIEFTDKLTSVKTLISTSEYRKLTAGKNK
ncbi:MAG: peptide deformylase [bacterium]